MGILAFARRRVLRHVSLHCVVPPTFELEEEMHSGDREEIRPLEGHESACCQYNAVRCTQSCDRPVCTEMSCTTRAPTVVQFDAAGNQSGFEEENQVRRIRRRRGRRIPRAKQSHPAGPASAAPPRLTGVDAGVVADSEHAFS
jgi:hypothetical protein